jgi:hypothetical protein
MKASLYFRHTACLLKQQHSKFVYDYDGKWKGEIGSRSSLDLLAPSDPRVADLRITLF